MGPGSTQAREVILTHSIFTNLVRLERQPDCSIKLTTPIISGGKFQLATMALGTNNNGITSQEGI